MKTVDVIYRYEGDDPGPRERPLDAAAAKQRMDDGNQAFAALLANLDERTGTAKRVIRVDPRDLGLLQSGTASLTQRPFAAVVGCADARVPIELIFN